jgi:copper chaperone CopZ
MKSAIRAALFLWLTLAAESIRAEYLHIQLRVYGLDCGACARAVTASVKKLAGVESVELSLKKGIVAIALKRGNTLKMAALKKRIRETGFRPMEATVTAAGHFYGSKFEVSGAAESYELPVPPATAGGAVELTFEVR